MPVDAEKYTEIMASLNGRAQLVAVSKTKPVEDILALYALGQRDFGENYVQEMLEKREALPGDIRWHFIGHLQSNKVKYIASFVGLVHGVDSLKLLKEIDKQAAKAGRVIDCLLQVHIAREETKFGFDASELESAIREFRGGSPAGVPGGMPAAVTFGDTVGHWKNIRVRGLMGMASLGANTEETAAEFKTLKGLFDTWFEGEGILSMGMSGDYQLAVTEGSNMVRIGSLLFGKRS